MTPEQAKQLKKGDKILVEAEFDEIDADGNVEFRYPYRAASGAMRWSGDAVLCNKVSLPPERPKYDPCRKFKKGDRVRVVERHGRPVPACGYISVGEIYDVLEEDSGGDVALLVRGKPECISWYWLDLVTPVEELDPFFVMELKGAYGVYNTRFQPETEVCHFFADMHPHAKESAEAESARLNEENRKKKLQKETEQEPEEC